MKNNRLEIFLSGLLVFLVVLMLIWIYKALVYVEERPRAKQTVSPRFMIMEEVQNVE